MKGWADATDAYRSTIATNKLDTLLRDHAEDRLLIKMDVAGWEFRVLQGATQTLGRSPRPQWLVEICLTEHHPGGINPHFEDVFSVFWKHGYKSYTVGRERRAVGPEDIRRWVRARSRDFGGYNYEFTG